MSDKNPNTNSQESQQELLQSQGLTYTKKRDELLNARSSGQVLLIVGLLGVLALILLWLGILPLSMAFYMKVLYTVVLGVLFLFFMFLGLNYIRKAKVLEGETASEEAQTEAIMNWFLEHYPEEVLEPSVSPSSLSMEQLYFERYERITSLLRKQYHITDEKYLDYLAEKIYQIYSP